MPADTKKVLWTVFSVGVFLIIVLGVLLVVYYPEPDAANAPLAFDSSAAARGSVADEFRREAEPSASQSAALEPITVETPLPAAVEAPATGDITVVYGEKPAAGSLTPQTATSGPASGAASATPTPASTEAAAIKRTYTPAATSAAKPAPKPAASTASAVPAKPKPVAFTEYWIQAASLNSRTRAEELQTTLRLKGLSATILVKDLEGTTWYRVRIGPYPQKEEADGFLTTVRKVDGCGEAFVSKVTGTRML